MVQLLSAYIVGPTMFVSLIQALHEDMLRTVDRILTDFVQTLLIRTLFTILVLR